MKSICCFFKKCSLLIFLAAALFITSCQKEDTALKSEEEKAPTQKCECENEIAFPNIPGEVVPLKDENGQTKITLVKKNGKYIMGGDMILTQEQVDYLRTSLKKSNSTARTGIAAFAKLWPFRTVYFVINANLPNQARVINAITHWENQTNMTFLPRTNQPNYVEFVAGDEDDGCSSYVGMIGGRQVITLEDDCSTGNTIHEIGHAIGFYHEQSRADRDNFIIVNFNNIESGKEHNFETYVARGENGFEIGTFDFNSIMLYDSYAFSKNALPTMTRLDGTTFFSQRSGLSAGDIETYNYMYNRPFFTIDRINHRYEQGTDYYQDTWDAVLRAYTDATMTTPLNSTEPWPIQVKKTIDWSNYPTPQVNYYSRTIQPGTNSVYLGEDIYRVEYVGGGDNLITDQFWLLGEYIVSRP